VAALLFITVRDGGEGVSTNLSFVLNVITIYAAFLRSFQDKSSSGTSSLLGTPNNTPPSSPEHYYAPQQIQV